MSSRNLCITLASLLLLGACAGSGSLSDRRIGERCPAQETMVCYGRNASKIGDRNRLENIDFCRCERVDRIR